MPLKPIFPVILCGGSGTRLWPLSRQSFPKQFISLINESKYTLLQDTLKRISKLDNAMNPILICNEEHRFIAAEQLRELDITPNRLLLEPIGKNTAPAIINAALIAKEIDDDPLIMVLSSDHNIKDNNKFLDVVNAGIEYALEDSLVTFGVVPCSPETGYGYIKADKPFNLENIYGEKIIKFIEKPTLEIASELIKDKRYTWNSGMFLFKAQAIIDEIKIFNKEIYNACEKSLKNSSYDLDFQRINESDFVNCPSLSIDVAVMEKTKKGVVLPLDAGWSDVGNWYSLWEISNKDKNNNVIEGRVFTKNTRDSFLKSQDRLIVGLGLNNLVVSETNDAILIADKSQTQDVKELVEYLKNKNIPEGVTHQKIFRPWGNYSVIEKKIKWQVKLITVNPGGALSLQKHNHRSEHWIIVTGQAKVEIDEEIKFLHENQSCYIPLGSKHRLSNPGNEVLMLIEVQSGNYLGEDDIVRFDDIYGRSI